MRGLQLIHMRIHDSFRPCTCFACGYLDQGTSQMVCVCVCCRLQDASHCVVFCSGGRGRACAHFGVGQGERQFAVERFAVIKWPPGRTWVRAEKTTRLAESLVCLLREPFSGWLQKETKRRPILGKPNPYFDACNWSPERSLGMPEYV